MIKPTYKSGANGIGFAFSCFFRMTRGRYRIVPITEAIVIHSRVLNAPTAKRINIKISKSPSPIYFFDRFDIRKTHH